MDFLERFVPDCPLARDVHLMVKSHALGRAEPYRSMQTGSVVIAKDGKHGVFYAHCEETKWQHRDLRVDCTSSDYIPLLADVAELMLDAGELRVDPRESSEAFVLGFMRAYALVRREGAYMVYDRGLRVSKAEQEPNKEREPNKEQEKEEAKKEEPEPKRVRADE